jgi:N utilization substance protein A
MTKIVLTAQTIQTITLFEQLTGAHVKDCVPSDDRLIFIVHDGEIAKAIGKGGQHVRTLERKLKKKIKVVEFHTDVLQFVKNVVAPLKLNEIKMEDTTVYLTAKDLKTRGLLIGRGASNLRTFEAIVQRYFPIKELRVT